MSIFNLANADVGHGIVFDGFKKITSNQFSKNSKIFDDNIKRFIEFAKSKKKKKEDKEEKGRHSVFQEYRVVNSFKSKL